MNWECFKMSSRCQKQLCDYPGKKIKRKIVAKICGNVQNSSNYIVSLWNSWENWKYEPFNNAVCQLVSGLPYCCIYLLAEDIFITLQYVSTHCHENIVWLIHVWRLKNSFKRFQPYCKAIERKGLLRAHMLGLLNFISADSTIIRLLAPIIGTKYCHDKTYGK